jgi:DNA-binding transcriptional MocR family regulator
MLYTRIADRFVSLIERGTLRPGDRLPSLRRTSTTEQVSLSTSLQAYALLEMRGFVEARPQSGFYVRPHVGRALPEPALAAPRHGATQVDVAGRIARVLQSTDNPALVGFGAACPSPALLPTRKLAHLVATVARTGLSDTNTYSFPPGRRELRRELARRAMDWGGNLGPDDILVTAGATEAINLALMATTRRGDAVAVESPVYFGTLLLLETLGLRAVEVATDPRHGLLVDALERVLSRRKVAAVIASPTCQNPLGSVMPDPAKQALARLLERYELPLIEDDVYGEASHDDRRPAPVKAWDPGGWVLLCSSFSKTLAPGYRIGWIAGGRYHDRLVRLKFATTLATPAVPQLAIAAFMRSDGYSRFMTRVRRAYRDQVTRAREAIARHFPDGTRVTLPRGGFVLWIELPHMVDGDQVADDAEAAGISVSPGSLFSAQGRHRAALRVSCGQPWTAAHDRAIEKLGSIVRRRLESPDGTARRAQSDREGGAAADGIVPPTLRRASPAAPSACAGDSRTGRTRPTAASRSPRR